LNGKSFFVSFKITDFTFDGQECNMVIVEDKTSQLRLNMVKNKAQENKAQALKIMNFSVSHNARSPLTSISMLCENLIRKT
jgi:sensor domain CHASE-containing protein